jgi:hypothetical protein
LRGKVSEGQSCKVLCSNPSLSKSRAAPLKPARQLDPVRVIPNSVGQRPMVIPKLNPHKFAIAQHPSYPRSIFSHLGLRPPLRWELASFLRFLFNTIPVIKVIIAPNSRIIDVFKRIYNFFCLAFYIEVAFYVKTAQ